jgi:hypothetical protein
MCGRSLQGNYGAGCTHRPCTPKDSTSQDAHLQSPEQPRRREFLVGPVQFAELADRGLLRPEDSAATPDDQGPGNCAGYASIEAVRRFGPRGPTPSASEALAGARGVGGSLQPTVAEEGNHHSDHHHVTPDNQRNHGTVLSAEFHVRRRAEELDTFGCCRIVIPGQALLLC